MAAKRKVITGIRSKPTFTPDWGLTPVEALAVTLNLSLNAHIPGWPGCTDEQLDAVATDVLKHLNNEHEALGFQKAARR
jgi:hypothetical protein